MELHGTGIFMKDAHGHDPREAARLQEAEEAVDEEEENWEEEEVESPYGMVESQDEEEREEEDMRVEEELVAPAPDNRLGRHGHGQPHTQCRHTRNHRT